MLNKLLPITRNKLLVLEEIYKHEKINLSTIANNLNLELQIVFRTLKEVNEILDIKIMGKIKLYSIKSEYLSAISPLIERLRLEKSFGVNVKIFEILKGGFNIEKLYVFGSYAKYINSVNSDVDIIIVSDDNILKIKKIILDISKKTSLNIEPVIFTSFEFEEVISDKNSRFFNIISNLYERIEVLL